MPLAAVGLIMVMALFAATLPPRSTDGLSRAEAAATGDAAGAVAPEVARALEDAPMVRVIVSLRVGAGAEPNARAAISAAGARALAVVVPGDFNVDRRYRATPALAGWVTDAGVRALAAQPDVLRVSLDKTVHAELTEAVPLIRADAAQTQLGVTGAGVTVAVLDTGIDTDHPLLADSITHEECYLADSVCPAPPNVAEDANGHGTHVSGIITSNGPPIGVAPGAAIEAYKILADSGQGEFSDVLLAYDDIVANHPEVDLINMSLSDGDTYAAGTCEGIIPAADSALAASRAMGITTFAAAGNNHAKEGLGYPACLTDVVAVGAVYDADVGPMICDANTAPDQITCFSQSDSNLDLVAPGAVIRSTFVGGGLANLSGTSMASPMAVGVAALVLQTQPSLTPAVLEARLKATGHPRMDVNGVVTCRIDAYEAVINDGGPICPPSVARVGGIATAPDVASLPAARAPRSQLAAYAAGLVLVLWATGAAAVALRRRNVWRNR